MIPDKMKTAYDGEWNGTEICAANKDVGFIVRKDGIEVRHARSRFTTAK
jgi:hypothetical protein